MLEVKTIQFSFAEFAAGRQTFVLDHKHGRHDVTCNPAILWKMLTKVVVRTILMFRVVDFEDSLNQMNLKAYRLALIKDSGSDDYRPRISFNLGPLPLMMSNVSVTALATTLSINSQTTKSLTNYTKTLVQVHRWNSTPPQFIYLDLHGNLPGGVVEY